MSKKNNLSSGIVYSTDKDFKFDKELTQDIILSPAEQKLKVKLDNKHRGGKVVTIVEGFKGKTIEETGKKLKVFCGTGGYVKDGQIIVQGDNREKVMQWLLKNGYKVALKP